jgi:hypothetical protein
MLCDVVRMQAPLPYVSYPPAHVSGCVSQLTCLQYCINATSNGLLMFSK